MSVLTDYLKTEAPHVRDESARQKAAKLDWKHSAEHLIHQMNEWLKVADQEGLLHVREIDHEFEDYDLGTYSIKGLAITLGRSTLRIIPSHLNVVGAIQPPGETGRRKIDGRFMFDNGTDSGLLYRVKDGDRDIWLWWTHGGIGKPFDRESFEATVVSLLR